MFYINVTCRKVIKLGYLLVPLMLIYFSFWIKRCISIRDISCEDLWEVVKASNYMNHEVQIPDDLQFTCLCLDSIPDIFQNLVILSEDRRFYNHGGVDVFRSLTAVKTNLNAGRKVLGASTLTQQLVKILWGSRKRTLIWKIHESAGALFLDGILTKEQILELYFNCAVWIPGYIGIYDAVFNELHKNVSSLTPDEIIALTASLPDPVLPGNLTVNRRYFNRYRRLKNEAVKTGLLKTK